MKEEYYRYLGWGCLLVALFFCLKWSIEQSGPTGWIIAASERVLHVKLIQISYAVTFLVVGVPAYLIKNYLDGLAWEAHVRSLPPPDVRESAKRSKYIKQEGTAVAPAPAPVQMSSLPKGQEEFIATCTACGNLFPARKDLPEMKCPNCGEVIPCST